VILNAIKSIERFGIELKSVDKEDLGVILTDYLKMATQCFKAAACSRGGHITRTIYMLYSWSSEVPEI